MGKMKLSIFTILSVLTINIIFSACTPPNGLYYQSINVLPIYQDIDGKLYFSYANGDYYSFYGVSSKQRSLYLFNDDNKTWEKIAIKDSTTSTILSDDYNNTKVELLFKTLTTSMVSSDMASIEESITSEENIVKLTNIYTKKNSFSDVLPTKEEIINASGINLFNSNIKFFPLTRGQFYWDKKSHIVSACVNESQDGDGVKYCDDVYAFSLITDQNGSWNIENIADYNVFTNSDNTRYHNLYEFIYTSKSKLGDQSSLVYDIGTFDKTENGVILKKPEPFYNTYINMVRDIYSSTVNMAFNATFDEQGNMHLFYNKKEDIKNENYDYFWYGYFTKENPTTPLYEQKILWK